MKTINNNIEEVRVSFDNAKLLKEKGFDVNIDDSWIEALEHTLDVTRNGLEIFQGHPPMILSVKYHKERHNIIHCKAPTQEVAIDWIRINFGIHIYINCIEPFDYEDEMNPYPKIVWVSKINDLKKLHIFVNTYNGLAINHFYTPEEAKEAAINHVLTTLI